jgi:formylglycine-generating enzyme required for sulfatase activity
MGSAKSESDRNTDEAQHRVTISKSFQMGVTEVTQAQWKTVMGTNNPSRFKGDDLPVEGVTFEDAVRFCEKLSKREGVTYRLPTESEWEYACRASKTSSFAVRDGQPLSDVAWFNHDGLKIKSTHPVGKLKPNAWGLHDMHGNVWEWCSDFSGHYPTDPVTDPTGPASGKHHIIRGGSWFNPARYARSAHRGQGVDGALFGMTGFRVVLQNPE